MTWFGTVSAWAAIVAAAAFAFFAAAQFYAGVVPWLTMFAAALLLTGAFRTLRKMSGGLRLLCGAWGFAAAFLFGAINATSTIVVGVSISQDTAAAILTALPFVALLGLLLTVTHKETK